MPVKILMRPERGARGAAAAAAVRALVVAALVLLVDAHAPAAAAAAAPAAGDAARLRKLLQYPFPREAYDRVPPRGAAKGQKAKGQPDPLPGLQTPDIPGLSAKSASMEDLVLTKGYPLETYPVETSDGFILRMYRIPHGKTNATGPGPKPVVLLHHGVTLASSSFVVLDPKSSMAFYLADAGFDVWMLNTRGNTFSKGHRRYRNTDEAYWAFSMDELALIDVPTQIDFALSFTGQKQLALVGHSQGCTLPTMLLAAKPEYNQKLWLLMLLGPVTFADKIKATYLVQQARTGSPLFLQTPGAGYFIPNMVTSQMASGCENGTAKTTEWCYDLINYMFYGHSEHISPDDTPLVSSTWPSTVSTRNLYHWSQMYHAHGGLQMYDWGTNCTNDNPKPYKESCNQAKYGQDDPPVYDLTHVTARTALFQGDIDVMATKEDVAQLTSSWSANVVYQRSFPKSAHMDFVWARAPIMREEIIRVLWQWAPRPNAPSTATAKKN